jgi:uncharacterized protein YcfL
MKMRNSILLVAVLYLSCGCSSQTQDTAIQPAKQKPAAPSVEKRHSGQWQASSDGSISFRISTEKKTYSVSERVTVRAELKNNSKADVSIFPVHVAFGNVGDAIRISGPQEVKYRGPFKSMPHPKKVVLSAGSTTTAEATIDDRYEGFGVEGEYKITCTFSGISSTVVITLVEKND